MKEKKANLIAVMFLAIGLTALTSGCEDRDEKMNWTVTTVDTDGSVGGFTSIAADSNDKVHISYYNWDRGCLKYATNQPGAWQTSIIDFVGDAGEPTSIALDSRDKIHISYFKCSEDNEYGACTKGELNYATNESGSWQIFTIDSVGVEGGYASIAVDSNDSVHISYHDGNKYDLKYATNMTGTWQTFTVDSDGMVGEQSSITIDSGDKAHISYYKCGSFDYWGMCTVGNLKYATNESGSWQTYTLDAAGDTGWHSSIAMDSKDKIHISYHEGNNENLKYVTNSGGSWQIFALDSKDAGNYISLAIDSDDNVHIAYYKEANTNLKYTKNTSGLWEFFLVDSIGDVGGFASLALDSKDNAHISYYDWNNHDLKYATNRPQE